MSDRENMDRVLAAIRMAAVASMEVVKGCQFETKAPKDQAEFKPDTSIVMPADKRSDTIVKHVLRGELGKSINSGQVAVHGEESGVEGNNVAPIKIYVDALDGSRPNTVGALTSTVIIAVCDQLTGKVIACVVGEPASGRICWAMAGNGAAEGMVNSEKISPIHTWKGDKGTKNTVFLDSYPGLHPGGKVVMTDDQLSEMHRIINARNWGTLMLGSNGQHMMLVAMGRELSAGSVTTAIGGSWDVAPVLLVLEAGGAALAFKVNADGDTEYVDPLMIANYDILVTGKDMTFTKDLAEAVLHARGTSLIKVMSNKK